MLRLRSGDKCILQTVVCMFRLQESACCHKEAFNFDSKPTRSCKHSSSNSGKRNCSRTLPACSAVQLPAQQQELSTDLLVLLQRQQLTGAAAQTAGLSNSARKQIGFWLAGCSGWVFSMVVLGGMTRLTRSGLSMTDWKFTGETSPQTLVHIVMHVLSVHVES